MLSILKPTKGKIIISVILIFMYLLVWFLRVSYVCLGGLSCGGKTHHSVPSDFPGAYCGQVCMNQGELILNYTIYIITEILLPSFVIYLIVSVLIFVFNQWFNRK